MARAKKMEADREQMVSQLKASMEEIQKSMDEGRERSESVSLVFYCYATGRRRECSSFVQAG